MIKIRRVTLHADQNPAVAVAADTIQASQPTEALGVAAAELVLPGPTAWDAPADSGTAPTPLTPVTGTFPADVAPVWPAAAMPPQLSPGPLTVETASFTFAALPASVVAAEIAPIEVVAPVAAIAPLPVAIATSAAPEALPPPAASSPAEDAAATAPPPAAVAAQQVVFIDPSASGTGDGSAAHPFSSWLFVTLVAGNTYLQKAGTVVDGPLVLRGEGSDAAPIVIGSYGTGAPPVVQGSIVIENAAHLTLSGFTAEGSQYPGVIIRGGAHDITVAGNTIQNNGLGVWFGADAGGGNRLIGNTITGNATHGVAFDKLDSRAEPSLVAGNLIADNGCHGIEINANGIVVSGNTVAGNGLLVSGSSGIHVYGGVGAADGFGSDNVITLNTITDTHEAGHGLDGNGIQLDQFTARNVVTGNTASGNDGAGIILYDSSSNFVSGNVLSGNAVDRSGSHPWLAELMLAGEDRFDLTRNNVVVANVVTPRDADVQGLWVDLLTADNENMFGCNGTADAPGGAIDIWDASAIISTSPAPAGDIWLG